MKTSIQNLDKVKEASLDFSINAEMFTPDIIKLREKLKANGYKQLGDYAKYIKRGAQPEYSPDGTIKALRSVNIRENGFSDDRQEFVTEDFYNKNPRMHIFSGDVLLNSTGVGTLGRCCFVYDKDKFVIDGHITRISKLKELSPEFLYIYLNSKYGQLQINKLYKGSSGQIEIYPEQIQLIYVKPLKIQKIISKIVKMSFQYKGTSTQNFIKASGCLQNELSVNYKCSKHKLGAIKNYSDAKNANRLDAEYFQSKYDEIIGKIKTYPNGWDIIGNQFEQNKKSFLIDMSSEYKYVEIGSINITSGEIFPERILGKNLPANAKINLQKDDILISKVRTYRGAIAIVENTNYVGSGAFTVLQEKVNSNVNKETLYTYFKLKPILDLTLKYNTGSSYPTITDDDILNMPIPIFQLEVQSFIKNNIQQAKKLQFQSKQLLEIAKRGVEIAIEQDENIATGWLNQELKKIGVEL